VPNSQFPGHSPLTNDSGDRLQQTTRVVPERWVSFAVPAMILSALQAFGLHVFQLPL
jgi:hypothetical protein